MSQAGGETLRPILFVRELHFEQILHWNQARKEVLTADILPQTGYILPGKAAGFLYRTDSSVAWIENLVAAPELSREERSVAIDAIVKAVSDEARRLGFKMLLGYTVLDAVVKRAERLGFAHVEGNFQLVALQLQS
ncbi:hypothetical protein SAMN05444354_10395 [Stigmatella aurantiaca]|uniref:N-acetyltransferase domain-containing protein n=1 Tax=Stigmatella aurantiaca TaxID=41 RepID=A0A1H7L1M3_STIAU|nr:hypothetical protein [Stigmatella aurantiaca]SEK92963.1 hypothetical protein SAMN05444354_10395 [Stigmatella aurantiaca]